MAKKTKYFKHLDGGKLIVTNGKDLKERFQNGYLSTDNDDMVGLIKKTQDYGFGLIVECDENGLTAEDKKAEIERQAEIDNAVAKATKQQDAKIAELEAMLAKQEAK